MRIIIYTNKMIKKNEQLGYNYGLFEDKQPFDLNNHLILKNNFSNCYLNVILQLLFVLRK